jgi:hypothetical protein
VSPPLAKKASKGISGSQVGVARGDADDVDLASFVAKRNAVTKKVSAAASPAAATNTAAAVVVPTENVWESSNVAAAVSGGAGGQFDEDGGAWENPNRKAKKEKGVAATR